jgi:hypothetical protein
MRAIEKIELAESASPKGARKLDRRAGKLIRNVRRYTERASRKRVPRVPPACAGAVNQAVEQLLLQL